MIPDLPERNALSNELHARPFPSMNAPARMVYLVIKRAETIDANDRDADRTHLIELLDQYGMVHPQTGATHYAGKLGKHQIKWECHTEFVAYSVIFDGLGERAFDPRDFDVFPEAWLGRYDGARLTSIHLRIDLDGPETQTHLADWFTPESLAVSSVIDDAAKIASDFRIDPAGHTRMAMFVSPETGPQRIGRIAQRLCEIETYKAASMLGFFAVKTMGGALGQTEARLGAILTSLSDEAEPTQSLDDLLRVSSDIERVTAETSFRLSATDAYQRIVTQRVKVLREHRFAGYQTFDEFMTRRFDPAMRTVASAKARLMDAAERSSRAAHLLSTQVDVERSAQNQAILERMDSRADLQLRLQGTVEGLSVIAISYYGVSLLTYLLLPLAKSVGIDKVWLMAGATPLVLLCVWALVRRIKRHLH